MDYTTFKEYVKLELYKYLPKEKKDYTVKVITVVENYRSLDVVKLVPNQFNQMEAGIYLEPIYREFLTTLHINKAMEHAIRLLTEAVRYNETIEKHKIYMILADTGSVESLLKDYPHRSFYGLSIFYRIFVDEEHRIYYPCVLTNDMMNCLGLTEEELYKNAWVNTKTLFPPVVQTIGENVYEMITGSSIDEEIRTNMPESVKSDDSMYVIKNRKGMNGAVYLVYNDVMEQIAERSGTDFFLLPSTIYDMYAVPVKKGEMVDMEMVLEESRAEGMSYEEKLSSQIYYYDYEGKTLKQYVMSNL